MYQTILTLCIVSIVLIDAAVGLKCIDCSSLHDDKCGKTFGYSMKEARDKGLEVTCEGMTVACRKTESVDTLSNQVVVSRSCWNATGAELLNKDFFKCKEIMTRLEVCYCKAGDKADPCNGMSQIQVNSVLCLLGLLPFMKKLLF